MWKHLEQEVLGLWKEQNELVKRKSEDGCSSRPNAWYGTVKTKGRKVRL